MLCQKCQENDAAVHITVKHANGDTEASHLCESCDDEGRRAQATNDSDICFVKGHISHVDDSTVVIKVSESSHYSPGQVVSVRARFIPKEFHRIGSLYWFKFPRAYERTILVKA